MRSACASFSPARQAFSSDNVSFSVRSVSSAASACTAASRCSGVSVPRSICASTGMARLLAQCREAGRPDPPTESLCLSWATRQQRPHAPPVQAGEQRPELGVAQLHHPVAEAGHAKPRSSRCL